MPASCVTRWWTSLLAVQFIKDQQEALFDVLYKLKSNSIKYLLKCNKQKLIRVMCNIYEPLKTLGEHMSSKQVVTASSIWPIYLKLKNQYLKTITQNIHVIIRKVKIRIIMVIPKIFFKLHLNVHCQLVK